MDERRDEAGPPSRRRLPLGLLGMLGLVAGIEWTLARHDVTVYAPQTTNVLRTISQGIDTPGRLAFDGAGNLFVPNLGNNTVTVYAAGSGDVLRTISQGVNAPYALAIGP